MNPKRPFTSHYLRLSVAILMGVQAFPASALEVPANNFFPNGMTRDSSGRAPDAAYQVDSRPAPVMPGETGFVSAPQTRQTPYQQRIAAAERQERLESVQSATLSSPVTGRDNPVRYSDQGSALQFNFQGTVGQMSTQFRAEVVLAATALRDRADTPSTQRDRAAAIVTLLTAAAGVGPAAADARGAFIDLNFTPGTRTEGPPRRHLS